MEFTPEQQEVINGIVAKEKDALKKKVADVEGQLTTLSQEKNLTEEQKAALESNLENLRAELRTKEEQAKHERDKAVSELQGKVKELSAQAEDWRTKHITSTIERSILDAASSGGAYNPKQIKAILGPTTKMDETGDIKTIVNVEGKELVLSPEEAVKRMSEAKEFANLFNSNLNSGSGFTPNSGKGPEIDPATLTTEDYIKLRKEGKLKL
jgi:predicted nuclease with TOPRIM domain